MEDLLINLVKWSRDLVESSGYTGIFILMFLESTVIPVPAEAALLPAGSLVYTGQMSFTGLLLSSTAGCLLGALFTYTISRYWGWVLLDRFGHTFWLSREKLAHAENFFARHGTISVFLARLIAGVRHFISIPAGMVKMPVGKFALYTALGGALSSWLNILCGYLIARNVELFEQYSSLFTAITVCLVVSIVVFYIWRYRKKSRA